MTDYALWRRGLRGPSLIVLFGTPNLDEYDKAHRLAEPVPLKSEHVGLALCELANLYPPPPPSEIGED